LPIPRRHWLARAAALAWPALGVSQPSAAASPPVRVAAASDLKFALADVAGLFQKETGIAVMVSLGSSGNFMRQIQQGLPVDLFLSADEAFVFRLADAGLTRDRGTLYATGRIALVAPRAGSLPLDPELRGLMGQWAGIDRFAIANPEHAPYGRAARQALDALGLWARVQPKLVLGENIAQATQFVATGAAQAGLTALSLALAPEVAVSLRHVALPASLHAPLRQRMVLLKQAGPAARAFHGYLQGPVAREVFRRYGFTV
jgi:molybdate transport system substrate-binding protein